MSHSALKTTMARFRQLVQQVPTVQAGIQQVKYEVLGQMPRLGMRTGHQYARKQLKGVYYNQYYMDPIEKFARMVIPGFQTELEERRAEKLAFMKRKGRGPPKKGSGARSKKKKRS